LLARQTGTARLSAWEKAAGVTQARVILALALVIPLGTLLTVDVSRSTPYLFADEAVYHAMTTSLVHDRDLQYDTEDLTHIYRDYPAGPRGIILKQTADGMIMYAKPFLYSLAAAPFFHLWHLNGFLLLNCLCWWGIIWITVRSWGLTLNAVLFAIGVLVFSAFSAYVLWIHPEVFSAFLIMVFLGFWRALDTSDSKTHNLWKVTGMAIALIAATWIKLPAVCLCIGPVMDWMMQKHWKRIGIFAMTAIVMVMAAGLVNILMTGDLNPYGGNRKVFIDHYPFETPDSDFGETGNSWSSESAGFHFIPGVLLANAKYFFIGRYTGLFWYYFPGCICLLLWLSGNRDRMGTCLLLSLGAVCAIHLILIPTNYHGGGGALGNRYFSVYYPALLCILPRPPSKRIIIGSLSAAALLSGIYVTQAFSASYRPGIHTLTGPYSRLPVEWTLTGSFPIFDPRLRMVQFDGFQGTFYFLDRNCYGKQGTGFWLKGDSTTRMILELPECKSRLTFRLSHAPEAVTGHIRSTGIHKDFTVLPGKTQQITLNNLMPNRLIDIYGRERFILPLSFTVQGGLMAKYASDSDDTRYLGVHVSPMSSTKQGQIHSRVIKSTIEVQHGS
jgi:hypothetical protein